MEKEKEELQKLVKDLRQQARDEANAQQRAGIIETVCKTIPLAISAVAPMVKTYLKTNQDDNDQQEQKQYTFFENHLDSDSDSDSDSDTNDQ